MSELDVKIGARVCELLRMARIGFLLRAERERIQEIETFFEPQLTAYAEYLRQEYPDIYRGH